MIDSLLKSKFVSIDNHGKPWVIFPGMLIAFLLGSACSSPLQRAGNKRPDARPSTSTPADAVAKTENRGQHTATAGPVSASPTATSRPTATPRQPDLVVWDVSVGRDRIQKGAQPYTRLSVTVKNVGSAPVPGKTFHMRLVLNGEPQSTWMTSGGKIPAGGTVTREVVVGAGPSWELGRYQASIKVDDDDSIAEANEKNNRSDPVSFTIYQPETPDLIVSKIYMSRGSIPWGERPWTWVTYTVKNVGDGPVEDDLVYNRIWKDGYIQGGWADVNGSIPPGGTRTQRFAVGHEGPIGEHTVRVEVDYRNSVREGREDNNMSDPVTYDVLAPAPGE